MYGEAEMKTIEELRDLVIECCQNYAEGYGGDVETAILDEFACIKAENERLRAALREIAKGEGAFSRDPFTHAANCVENMKSIAESALRECLDKNFLADSQPQGCEKMKQQNFDPVMAREENQLLRAENDRLRAAAELGARYARKIYNNLGFSSALDVALQIETLLRMPKEGGK